MCAVAGLGVIQVLNVPGITVGVIDVGGFVPRAGFTLANSNVADLARAVQGSAPLFIAKGLPSGKIQTANTKVFSTGYSYYSFLYLGHASHAIK